MKNPMKYNLLNNKTFRRSCITIFVFLVVISAYHLYFAQRIVPGVVIGSTKVGGMSYSKAKRTLEAAAKNQQTTLTFKSGEKNFDIPLKDISFEYNWDASLSRAYEIGRTGNIIIDTKDKIAGLFKNLYIKPFYDYDEGLLSSKLVAISGELNSEGQNAIFTMKDNTISIMPERYGTKVDYENLFNSVISNFEKMDFRANQIIMEEDKPNIVSSDLSHLLTEAQQIISNPLKITYGKKEWKLTKEQIIDFLTVQKEKGSLPELVLNKSTFEAYVDSLAQQINEPPRGLVTETDDKKVKKFELLKEGKELDVKSFTELFKNTLFSANESFEVPIKPVTELASAEKYGINELLAIGESKFNGSGTGRIKNLSLAAERTNGVLVPPDSVYSFNNSVGEISAKTGYDSAYIIQNGRTVLGEGGGVCQTSTTLFRAVLNAGLPVVSRHAHAYRVHYYEIDKPTGFDASVFQPSLDFQFKNDTKGYILIQTEVDKQNFALTFKLYGTNDGRSVEITEPVMSNVAPPPEPLYQDDPTLPKGTVKQVDFAAWGANVTFNRTVSRDGQELFKDTFSSRYQPWRAVYLKGTK